MREIGLILFGVVIGIFVQRVAGRDVDKIVDKASAAYEAFQK
jgi:hypothetical protein